MTLHQELQRLSGAPWLARVYAEVASTMDEARAAAGECDEGRPGLVLSERQRAGRGRRGRPWSESEGALYCTLICIAPRIPPQCGAFALTAGCVIAELVEALGCPMLLKWPNDLLGRDGRKVGGILIETCSHARGRAILVGVGLNVSGTPEALSASAGALCHYTAAPLPKAEDIAAPLAVGLWQAWRRFLTEGLAGTRERWLARAAWIGREMQTVTPAGVCRGIFTGIDDDGALLLTQGGETLRIAAGDVAALEAR